MMKRLIVAAAAVLAVGCSTMDGMMGWTTLVDGEKGLENFNRVGDANWRAEGGAIVADKLTNSGVFLRAQDPRKIGAVSAYEVNIYDARPGQEYSTAAIVDHAKVPVP